MAKVVQLREGEPAPASSPSKQIECREQEALASQHQRRASRVPVSRIGQDEKGRVRLLHEDDSRGFTLFMEGLGTTDADFAHGVLKQMINVASQGKELDLENTNFVLGAVTGIKPRDEVEAMLGMQMAAVHLATTTFARRLAHVETLPQQESAEKAFNKLARTFATQVEALKRYRSKGEQRVYVERVDVRDGGQAIVGNVTGGGGNAKSEA